MQRTSLPAAYSEHWSILRHRLSFHPLCRSIYHRDEQLPDSGGSNISSCFLILFFSIGNLLRQSHPSLAVITHVRRIFDRRSRFNRTNWLFSLYEIQCKLLVEQRRETNIHLLLQVPQRWKKLINSGQRCIAPTQWISRWLNCLNKYLSEAVFASVQRRTRRESHATLLSISAELILVDIWLLGLSRKEHRPTSIILTSLEMSAVLRDDNDDANDQHNNKKATHWQSTFSIDDYDG